MTPECAVAASEHPVAAHAVAECAGALLERGAVGSRVLLVAATMPFAGALGDIASALAQILRPHALAAVASAELHAGARAVGSGPGTAALPSALSTGGFPGGVPSAGGIAAMAIDLPGSALWRVGAGSTPEPRSDMFAVALCDPFSTKVPDQPEGPGGRSPADARPAEAASGTLLVALLSGAAAPGGNRLAMVSGGDLQEYSDGSVVLGLPPSGCVLLEANGYTPFAEPMRVTAANGTCVVALDEMPAAEVFEASVLRAPETLESASRLGLRRVGEAAPFSVRRCPEGLECSLPLSEGDLVEPVHRSAEGVARELADRIGSPGRALLSLSEAGAVEATPAGAREDPVDMLLAEAGRGDHLGLRPSSLWLLGGSATRRCSAPVTALALGT